MDGGWGVDGCMGVGGLFGCVCGEGLGWGGGWLSGCLVEWLSG